MLVKARVFNRQDGVFHHLRNFFDGREVSAFFTKFANDSAIGGVNTQRQLGAILGQIGGVGQLGISHDHGHTHHHQDGQQTSAYQAQSPQANTQGPVEARCFWKLKLIGRRR